MALASTAGTCARGKVRSRGAFAGLGPYRQATATTAIWGRFRYARVEALMESLLCFRRAW